MKYFNSFIRFSFLTFWIVFISMHPLVMASEQRDDSIQLIRSYVDAVYENNPALIKSTWTALSQNQEALTYMEINMPKLAYLFRVRGLFMQLQELQAERSKLFGQESQFESVSRSVQAFRGDLSPLAVKKVEKFSLSRDEGLRRRTNGEIVEDAQGKPLQDNRLIALSNPNQNRIGNIQYIKNRVDALYSQKFQEVPRELVPRGDAFSLVPAETEADVRIQGITADVLIRQISQNSSVVSIYLNGQLIKNEINLAGGQQQFPVYLDVGRNIFRVLVKEQSNVSKLLLLIVFNPNTGDSENMTIELNSGEYRDIKIDSLL